MEKGTTNSVKLVLPGRPITKKNSQRIIINRRTGRPQVIQSERYMEYEAACLWHLKKYRVKFSGPVWVKARYWMPNRRSWPDLLGLLQATCDILEKAGIFENDRYVVSLDGSEIVGVDKDNPRVEVTIEEVA
jgi:Holliday junction resolvase RusA-like endonuclease